MYKKTNKMRKIIFLTLAIFLCVGFGHAQYSSVKYNLETPFTGIFTAERFTGDTLRGIGELLTDTIRGDIMWSLGSGFDIYKRSEDGLRDTLIGGWGLARNLEYVYSPEGKLVEFSELMYDFIETEVGTVAGTELIARPLQAYQYDAEGRIAVILLLDYGLSRFYDYVQNTIVDIDDDGELSSITQVVYNDSGYVCQTMSYVKTIISGKDTVILRHDTTEYVFDSENRLIRYRYNQNRDIVYEYTDSGYIRYYYSGPSQMLVPMKAEHIYDDESGLIQKRIHYSMVRDEWELSYATTYIYSYGSDALRTTTTSNDSATSLNRAYGVSGAIVVELEHSARLEIYSVGGQLMHRERLAAGRSYIPLASGIYIAQIGEEVFKLIVK